MKKSILLLIAMATFSISAQEDEKLVVQRTIEDFFAGFHAQDSMMIKATVMPGIIMQRVTEGEDGKAALRTDDFGQFLKAIVGIPKDKNFEEKITSYDIQIDGTMANAWTGFEFWMDGQISHCGVNSFQLIKTDTGWKIFYLVDVGRKEGCD